MRSEVAHVAHGIEIIGDMTGQLLTRIEYLLYFTAQIPFLMPAFSRRMC